MNHSNIFRRLVSLSGAVALTLAVAPAQADTLREGFSVERLARVDQLLEVGVEQAHGDRVHPLGHQGGRRRRHRVIIERSVLRPVRQDAPADFKPQTTRHQRLGLLDALAHDAIERQLRQQDAGPEWVHLRTRPRLAAAAPEPGRRGT